MLTVVQDAPPRLTDLAVFLAAVATFVLGAKEFLTRLRVLPPHHEVDSAEGQRARVARIPPP